MKRDRVTGNVELVKLQEDIERDLWLRMKTEFSSMQAQIDQQGALILQLRDRIRTLETERDDWMKRALDAEKRKGHTGTGRNL